MNRQLELIECPRDAMQGWGKAIPTAEKIRYINCLLRAGFHTIDFGSFVSPKLIPQMADTAEVVERLDLSGTSTRLLAIIANTRGALEAIKYDKIHYLGFPFSVSETFQVRNTNSSREQSLERVAEIQEICVRESRELVVYLSMGFGNPYGDPYDSDILCNWMDTIRGLGVSILSVADTVGLATPVQVREVMTLAKERFPDVQLGAHLHSTPQGLESKLLAAFDAGCRRFDGAIGGIGGCPMADDELVGNMDTISMVSILGSRGVETGIDMEALNEARSIASQIFN
jgi:hydroxymethylglutaryl-CoA lyase